MDRGVDSSEFARQGRRDATVQRIGRAAEEACIRHPVIPTVADSEPELVVAELSADATLAAMHAERINARLELLYCPSVSGDLRMRLANRLGEINLQAASAAAEIERLHKQLAVGKTGCDDGLDLDVAEVHHRLWRLRELCLRHQEFLRQRSRKPGG